MKKWSIMLSVLIAGVMLTGMTCVAQEEEAPLTWKGEGGACLVFGDGEIEEVKFEFKFHVDSEGWVTGSAAEADESEHSAMLEKIYYGPSEDGVRPLIMVLSIKDSDEPALIIMKGKAIKIGEYSKRSMAYGEIYMRPYEKNGEIEKGLAIGDKTATEIYEDYMPSGLKKAIASSKLSGIYQIVGKIVDE